MRRSINRRLRFLILRYANEVTIPSGTKLSRYEIRAQLGAGGMGEAYRERDEKAEVK